jgi:hypothetical protein
MSFRTEYVTEMTDHERISALVWIGHHHPDVFDAVREDVKKQRAIRATREKRSDEGSGENG